MRVSMESVAGLPSVEVPKRMISPVFCVPSMPIPLLDERHYELAPRPLAFCVEEFLMVFVIEDDVELLCHTAAL
jgi:hypothetical protein